MKRNMIDLLKLYRNYLYSLKEREEYGTKYGDTDEIIEMYEEVLREYISINKKVKKINK